MSKVIRLRLIASVAGILLALSWAGAANAHVHVVNNANHSQNLANGQNHPGFGAPDSDGLRLSCAGIAEPADAGPAGYGLETAHHGPDAGTPGKSDGCYGVIDPTGGTPPPDNNPAID